MKLKITVTKEVLRRSMWCGTEKQIGMTIHNCAIALAVRDIFPWANILPNSIKPFGPGFKLVIPHDQFDFITQFDELADTPELRLELPELSFEIDLPQEVIDAINIDDIHKSETLELINPLSRHLAKN